MVTLRERLSSLEASLQSDRKKRTEWEAKLRASMTELKEEESKLDQLRDELKDLNGVLEQQTRELDDAKREHAKVAKLYDKTIKEISSKVNFLNTRFGFTLTVRRTTKPRNWELLALVFIENAVSKALRSRS